MTEATCFVKGRSYVFCYSPYVKDGESDCHDGCNHCVLKYDGHDFLVVGEKCKSSSNRFRGYPCFSIHTYEDSYKGMGWRLYERDCEITGAVRVIGEL